jgi:hypothetical protein
MSVGNALVLVDGHFFLFLLALFCFITLNVRIIV